MTVQWSPRALQQVQEIFEYIVRDRPHVAVEIVEGLFDTTELLAATPEMGTPWSPDQRGDIRFILFKTYRVLYRVDQDAVYVVAVRHTRRDVEAGGE